MNPLSTLCPNPVLLSLTGLLFSLLISPLPFCPERRGCENCSIDWRGASARWSRDTGILCAVSVREGWEANGRAEVEVAVAVVELLARRVLVWFGVGGT